MMFLADSILYELKQLNAAVKEQTTKLEVVRETASQCARELYNVKTAIRGTGSSDSAVYQRMDQHGETLQQMADDLTLLSDEVVTIRGRMCKPVEGPGKAVEPEPDTAEARQEQRERDSLLTGISNLLTYTPKVGGVDKED